MLALVGTCRGDKTPHVQCTNKSWKGEYHLSFQQHPPALNHGPVAGSFDEWFQSWDQTNDDDVRRLCEISWNASRALIGELVVKGGVPHGWGVFIGDKFHRVDVTAVYDFVNERIQP
jgi:hypothetical protein